MASDFVILAPPPPKHIKPRPLKSSLPPVRINAENAETLAEATSAKRFYHSGDIGDIIYSLPTIRELGGGVLLLGNVSSSEMKTREPMTKEKAESIAALLKLQSYIYDVRFVASSPHVDVDLNAFRDVLIQEYVHWRNLANCHLHRFGLSEGEDTRSWLKVDFELIVNGKPIIIHRSLRYQNKDFPWQRIVSSYRHQIIFVGSAAEHVDFCRCFGDVVHYPTNTLLDLARIIAGGSFFIGNQSAPRAIAEGLKVPVVVEGCPYCPNTHFVRDGAFYFYEVGDEEKWPKHEKHTSAE